MSNATEKISLGHIWQSLQVDISKNKALRGKFPSADDAVVDTEVFDGGVWAVAGGSFVSGASLVSAVIGCVVGEGISVVEAVFVVVVAFETKNKNYLLRV